MKKTFKGITIDQDSCLTRMVSHSFRKFAVAPVGDNNKEVVVNLSCSIVTGYKFRIHLIFIITLSKSNHLQVLI